MQSRVERERLLKLMGREPVGSWLVLARCAAGLAVIVLIVIFGLGAPINVVAPTPKPAAVAAAAGAPANMRSQPHRKLVFDERRARFEGGADRHSIASEAAQPIDRLPVVLR